MLRRLKSTIREVLINKNMCMSLKTTEQGIVQEIQNLSESQDSWFEVLIFLISFRLWRMWKDDGFYFEYHTPNPRASFKLSTKPLCQGWDEFRIAPNIHGWILVIIVENWIHSIYLVICSWDDFIHGRMGKLWGMLIWARLGPQIENREIFVE